MPKLSGGEGAGELVVIGNSVQASKESQCRMPQRNTGNVQRSERGHGAQDWRECAVQLVVGDGAVSSRGGSSAERQARDDRRRHAQDLQRRQAAQAGRDGTAERVLVEMSVAAAVSAPNTEPASLGGGGNAQYHQRSQAAHAGRDGTAQLVIRKVSARTCDGSASKQHSACLRP